jgi:ankyrin repeat protein
LLMSGAKVNERDRMGETALALAAFRNYPAICKILIDQGAIINTKDGDGYSPLMLARSKRNLEIVELLTQAGAKF